MTVFNQLASLKLSENKNLIISRNGDNIVLAQQLKIDDNGREVNIFMKNAIRVESEKIQELIEVLEKAKNTF